MSKKIGCSPNFLRWSIKWSLVFQDENHLVATKCFLVVPLVVHHQHHLVATKWYVGGEKKNTPSAHRVVLHSLRSKRLGGHQVVPSNLALK